MFKQNNGNTLKMLLNGVLITSLSVTLEKTNFVCNKIYIYKIINLNFEFIK